MNVTVQVGLKVQGQLQIIFLLVHYILKDNSVPDYACKF